jgi:broad specificity phosphatase PhoE
MPTLFFLRHGENRANLTKEFSCRRVDYPLTPRGRLQAGQAAAALRVLAVRAVYASPLRRALETAEIIAAALKLPVTVLEELRELDVGDLEVTGGSAEGWRLHNLVIQAWLSGSPETAFPGGEDWHAAAGRMRRGVERTLAEYPQGPSLLVGHGGLFAAALPDLCPAEDAAALRQRELYNCSLTELVMRREAGRWTGRVVRWADASHLHGEAATLVSAYPTGPSYPGPST